MPIRCEIVSQDRIVYQGNVDMVVLPGTNGMMGILPHHSPLLTTLQYGIITIRDGKDEKFFTVAGGIAEIQPNKVTILADAAENVEEIDLQRAENARRHAEEILSQKATMDTDSYLAIQTALRRSNLRLEAAKRFKRNRTPN